ncbi:MAG: BamA/TamA family outer membrane protein [Porphyromonas sp.]|nr:BamA/TamA family outer membrane protein [Porphyromonas sp.]
MKKQRAMKIKKTALICWSTVALLISTAGCSVAKYIPEEELFYKGVGKIRYEDKGDQGTVNNRLAKKDMENVLNYKPNNSLFGSAKTRLPLTYPFYFNKHFADSKNFFGRWLYKTFGDEPVLISEVNPSLRATVASQVLKEYGYFHSSVVPQVEIADKDSVSAKTSYTVSMGLPHLLDSIEYQLNPLPQEHISRLIKSDKSFLAKGAPFGVVSLQNERKRISDYLRAKGYYYFQPDHIVYEADTVQVPGKVALRVQLSEKMLPEAYLPWRIGNIVYNVRDGINSPLTDSLMVDGVLFRYNKKSPVRTSVLRSRVGIERDSLYNQEYQFKTLRSMSELNTFAYTNVNFERSLANDSTDHFLDVIIDSQVDKPYSTELEGVFKFKSNNQVGPGLNFSINRKNIFRGGELLTVTAWGSYEWETKNNRKGNSWDINSYELGLTTSLSFPRILLPWLYNTPLSFPASTLVSLNGIFLNRGRFYKQAQFGTDLTYRFQPHPSIRHSITPLSISYNHLISKTERFVEAINNNPILGLSFRNQFIPQFNYLFGYEYSNPLSKHGFSLQAYVAEAGNLLSTFYQRRPASETEPHKFLGAPFAQFVKGTLELRYNYQLTNNLQIAARTYAGAVYSYGNMEVAPYTEQFYAGGANSIRGFNVRTLGPGSYVPVVDDPLSFMDRTGDIRFEANVELRYKVLGALELATFIDAGNVWLMQPDKNRPNGVLSSEYFLTDVALGSGLGIRYDLQYLVLRFDVGLGLHQPSRVQEKYFNTFGDQFPVVFHLAIGYPF